MASRLGNAKIRKDQTDHYGRIIIPADEKKRSMSLRNFLRNLFN